MILKDFLGMCWLLCYYELNLELLAKYIGLYTVTFSIWTVLLQTLPVVVLNLLNCMCVPPGPTSYILYIFQLESFMSKHKTVEISRLFVCLFLFCETSSKLHSWSQPQFHHPASAFWLLGLRVCDATPRLFFLDYLTGWLCNLYANQLDSFWSIYHLH